MKTTIQRGRSAPRLALGLVLTGAALLLASCGGGSAPVVTPPSDGGGGEIPPITTPAEQTGRILGQITPFTAGQANRVMPVNAAVASPGTDFQAGVTSAGQFDLDLPRAGTVTTTYGGDLQSLRDSFASCSEFTTNAPEGFKLLQINELTTDRQESLSASSNGGTRFLQWWFATQDAAVTFSGRNCLLIGQVDATLNLKLGWNVIQADYQGLGSGNVVTSFAVTAAPDRVAWTQNSAVGAQSGGPSLLRPWIKGTSAR